MASAIASVAQMIHTAGDLRRAAKVAPSTDHAAKIHRAAAALEKQALAKVGQSNPRIGALLDTFA